MELHKDEDGSKYLQVNICGKRLELPTCLLYSRSGMVPHLTDHNLNNVANVHKFSHLPLASVYEQPGVDVMQKFSGTFHEFSSSQDTVWMLNCNDTYNSKTDIYKYNEEKSISIWAPSGRRKITPEEYMKIVEVFQFDIAVTPSDTIPSGMTKKRCRKSQERTQRFLDRCLQIKEEKKLSVPLLGVVEGGDSHVFREKSAKEVAAKNVDGYVLGGFNMMTSNWKELLQLSMSHLKDEKVKMMLGVLTPSEVVEAVEAGVDVFDSVIAYDATERGCALNFPFTNLHNGRLQNGSRQDCSNGNDPGGPAKKVKMDEKLKMGEKEEVGEKVMVNEKMQVDEKEEFVRKDLRMFEMDLNDKRYFDDNRSLVEGCTCYCCTHHMRAYLHHLLVTKEMLASVLLMMHNLSYWLEFFKEIRKCEKEKKLDEMKEILVQISHCGALITM